MITISPSNFSEDIAIPISSNLNPISLTWKVIREQNHMAPYADNFCFLKEKFQNDNLGVFSPNIQTSSLVSQGIFSPGSGNNVFYSICKTLKIPFFSVVLNVSSFSSALTTNKLEVGVSNSSVINVSSAARASNVITVTTANPHGFSSNNQVYVEALTDVSYNGQFLIVATPTSTTFTYASVGADGSSTSTNHSKAISHTKYVTAQYDKIASTVSIQARNSGTTTTIDSKAISGEIKKLALFFSDRSASVWIDNGNGWKVYSRARVDDKFDLRDPSVLATFSPFIQTNCDSGTHAITEVSAGYGGGVGAGNFNQINWDDGTPIIKDGKAYVVGNMAGVSHVLNDNSFDIPCSLFSVWSIDLGSFELKQVALINTKRNGLLYGENSGHAVYDRSSNEWILGIPNWGSYTNSTEIHTYMYYCKNDILTGVHILENGALWNPPKTTSLGGTATSDYDPHFVKIGDLWYAVYNNTSPAVGWGSFWCVVSRGPSLSNLSLVGPSSPTATAEGGKIQKIGGNWYMLASTSNSAYVYSIPALSYQGNINYMGSSPNFLGVDGGAIYHCNIIPIPEGGKTRYLYVAQRNPQYQGQNWSYGYTFIQISDQTVDGWEFPRRLQFI